MTRWRHDCDTSHITKVYWYTALGATCAIWKWLFALLELSSSFLVYSYIDEKHTFCWKPLCHITTGSREVGPGKSYDMQIDKHWHYFISVSNNLTMPTQPGHTSWGDIVPTHTKCKRIICNLYILTFASSFICIKLDSFDFAVGRRVFHWLLVQHMLYFSTVFFDTITVVIIILT